MYYPLTVTNYTINNPKDIYVYIYIRLYMSAVGNKRGIASPMCNGENRFENHGVKIVKIFVKKIICFYYS